MTTTAPHLRRLLIGILAATALGGSAFAATASASTVTLEGDVLVVRAAPGEKNWFGVGPSEDNPSALRISDLRLPEAADPSVCTPDEYSYNATTCIRPAGGVRLEAADGDDILDVMENLPAGYPVTLDGGPGTDVLRGAARTATPERMLGGPGNDTLTGGPGDDTLDGGAGDDDVQGQDGADTVLGGDGNDNLLADSWQSQDPDVVDGGPGWDQIEMNWQSESGKYQPPIDVSVDGIANDGRPDENDNVVGVERIYLTAPATLTGSDAGDELTVFNADGPNRLFGRGGDDKLSGFDLDDTIDGGAGADRIEGGYGNDTITGGPGRDTINGDVSGTSCHWIQCRMPYGNDTIDARDGEPDMVTCGIGSDSVKADPVDTVADDCETVDRSGAGAAGSGGSGAGAGTGAHGTSGSGGSASGTGADGTPPGVTLSGVRARRSGRAIVVTGRATGVARVTVAAKRGARRVALTRAAVRAGRFTARLRTGRGAVRITVSAGAARRTVAVR